MRSHDLAKILLDNPDMNIATFTNNHYYLSKSDSQSHGSINVATVDTYAGQHIMIGNMYRKDIDSENCMIKKDIYGDTK